MLEYKISLYGLLSLIGLVQTVYAFFYLYFRAGDIKRAVYPMLLLLVLSGALLISFVLPETPDLLYLPPLHEFFWLSIPVVSTIFIVQMAHIENVPTVHYQSLLLLLIPMVWTAFASSNAHIILSIILNGLSLLSLWINRAPIMSLLDHKVSGQERYWLIMAVITINVGLIGLYYALIGNHIDENEFLLIRVVLGLSLVYLVSTTMFRIYPQAIQTVDKDFLRLSRSVETKSDPALLKRLRNIIDVQKAYQEDNFSRTDLARELGVSETITSKLVSDAYGKSLPQLINEKRIAEACDLLRQTDLNISVIAEQVGFRSIASFNRVFREIKNESPTDFRKNSAS
jgi:AraC-like DNA-binding protein